MRDNGEMTTNMVGHKSRIYYIARPGVQARSALLGYRTNRHKALSNTKVNHLDILKIMGRDKVSSLFSLYHLLIRNSPRSSSSHSTQR